MMLTVNLPDAGRVVGQDPNLGGGSRSTRHHVPLGERSGEERAVMSGSQEVSAVHCQVDEKLVDRPQDTGLQPVVNPPCWASKTAVSFNLTIPSWTSSRNRTGIGEQPSDAFGRY